MSNAMTKGRILSLLQSENVDDQREGALAARDLPCQEALPWLIKLLQSKNVGVQEAAEFALRKAGCKKAVQELILLLESEDVAVRNLAMDILRDIGREDLEAIINLLKSNNPDLRIFAADILGSTDSPLVVFPLCDALLKDPNVNVRYQAAVSLGELGKTEAADCLYHALEEDEEWVKFAVIEALIKIRDESSLDVLAKALDNASELVGAMIVDALSEMGNVKYVPLLLRKLDSSSTALRNKIIKALVNLLGGKSLTLLSKGEREKFNEYLLAALEDNEEEIQDAAVAGLSFVGDKRATKRILALASKFDPEKDEERIQKIIEALKDIGINEDLIAALNSDNERLATICIKALELIGGKQAADLLIAIFWKKPRDMQREISRVLLNIAGPDARDFFMDVLAEHKDGDVLKNGLRFLGHVLRDKEAVEKLFEFLEHPWNDVKEVALDAIIDIGDEEVLARFKQLFLKPEPVFRLMAVYAFGKLAPEKCLEELKQALEDESSDVRKLSLEALAGLCEKNKELLQIIADKLYDESREVRLTFVELMGACTDEKSITYLLQALEDDDDWVKARALEALAAKKVKDALPRIIALLQSPSQLVRLKAVEALGEIGGQAAFRALLEVLSSDDEDIQIAAQEALAKFEEQNF
ncbi:HEAT repeat domain-containing protein [Desulfovulcanus sp.]